MLYLSSTVGTRATNTGNTSNGTTGTPGLSRGLVASLLGDGVRLALVLGNALYILRLDQCYHLKASSTPTVYLLHDIETDRGGQNGGERERGGSLCIDYTWSELKLSGPLNIHTPPEPERTLTVGREAILCLDLEEGRVPDLRKAG
jgi:hypothetical protein